MEEASLSAKHRKELLELARDLHIVGRSSMAKSELVAAVSEALRKKDSRPQEVTAEGARPEEPQEPPVEVTSEPPHIPELPTGYGKTKVALIEVDPYWVYAYWELAAPDVEAARAKLGEAAPDAKCVLRVYDVTLVNFDGTNANSFWDMDFAPNTNNWYINLWSPEKSVCAELGLRTSAGVFLPIARSNFVHTPRDKESPVYEEKWMLVKGKFEEVRQVSGPSVEKETPGPPPPPIPGPGELAPVFPREVDVHKHYKRLSEPKGQKSSLSETPAKEPGDLLEAMPTQEAPDRNGTLAQKGPPTLDRDPFVSAPPATANRGEAEGLPSGSPNKACPERSEGSPSLELHGQGDCRIEATSPGVGSHVRPQAPEEVVDIVLDAELILYGKGRPTTKVFVQGRPVQVRPDGSFTVRFALPLKEKTPPSSPD